MNDLTHEQKINVNNFLKYYCEKLKLNVNFVSYNVHMWNNILFNLLHIRINNFNTLLYTKRLKKNVNTLNTMSKTHNIYYDIIMNWNKLKNLKKCSWMWFTKLKGGENIYKKIINNITTSKN